jgi:hypothetical protein
MPSHHAAGCDMLGSKHSTQKLREQVAAAAAVMTNELH